MYTGTALDNRASVRGSNINVSLADLLVTVSSELILATPKDSHGCDSLSEEYHLGGDTNWHKLVSLTKYVTECGYGGLRSLLRWASAGFGFRQEVRSGRSL
jgi:hypothetical protein